MIEREVPCPRCHEACGWCSDYRFMHGQMRLPGSKRRCTIEAMNPDTECAVCGGSRKVWATTTYSRERPAAFATHQPAISTDSQGSSAAPIPGGDASNGAADRRAPEPCGGCGEADPAKRCLGCLHNFGEQQ